MRVRISYQPKIFLTALFVAACLLSSCAQPIKLDKPDVFLKATIGVKEDIGIAD